MNRVDLVQDSCPGRDSADLGWDAVSTTVPDERVLREEPSAENEPSRDPPLADREPPRGLASFEVVNRPPQKRPEDASGAAFAEAYKNIAGDAVWPEYCMRS